MVKLRDFRIRDGNYLIRSASTLDPLSQIAILIYDSSPDLFSAWFNGDRQHGVDVLTYLCGQPRSFFSYEHMLVAEDITSHNILAIANVVNRDTNLTYDYSFMCRNSSSADQVISSHIFGWAEIIKQYDKDKLFLLDFGTSNGRPINSVPAHKLMQHLVHWADKHGYSKLFAEYIGDNKVVQDFYRRYGFTRNSHTKQQYTDDSTPIPVTEFIRRAYTKNNA